MLSLLGHRLMIDLTADFMPLLCINYDKCQDLQTMSQNELSHCGGVSTLAHTHAGNTVAQSQLTAITLLICAMKF